MLYTSSPVVLNKQHLYPQLTARHIPTLALVLVLFSLLSGACGTQASSNITLKLITWNNPATVAALTQLNASFHKQYPDITVKSTVVSVEAYNGQLAPTRLQANDVDILSEQGGLNGAPQAWTVGAQKPQWQQWADAGQLMDLTGQPFINNYFPSAIVNSSTYKGKVYSISNGLVSYTGLFYNKEIFNQYHLQVPTTYSDFVKVCDTLKANGVVPLTAGGKELWPLGLLSQAGIAEYFPDQQALSKGLWTGTQKFTDPKFVEVIQHSQKFLSYMENNFMGEDTAAALGRFASGKTAMLLSGTWDAPTILTVNPSAQSGYFPAPLSDDPQANSHLYGKYADDWLVAAKSPHKDAALKWMSFISDPHNYAPYAKTNGIIPVQNVSVDIPLSKDVKPYLADFKLAWDQVMVAPATVGQYAGGGIYHLEFLAPAGPVNSATELAQKTQADWETAVHK